MDNENMCGSEEVVEMFCEFCKKKDKSRSADGFCEDCVLYLCSKCLSYHSFFQSEHNQKNKDDIPKDVCLKVCTGHADEIIKFYCASCDKFFCSSCKENEHKTCENIKHLPHLVVDLESKEEFKSFVKEIEHIVSEIGDLESDIERKNVLVESISSGIKSQMETIRERLHQMADARIETITKDAEATTEKDKKALAADALDSSVIKSEINALNSDVQKLQRETNRCELFILMKESCIKRKALESDLQKLKEHGITEFRFEEEENCNNLFEAASHFGKLVFKDSECSDEQNGGKNSTKEELKELVAVKDEENRRLTKDIKDFEEKFSALEKEQGKLKELVAFKDEENTRLTKDKKDFEAKLSALEKEQTHLKELVVKKDEEIRRWNQDKSALEGTLAQTKKLVATKDEEIKRLNKDILDAAAKYSALERKQTQEKSEYVPYRWNNIEEEEKSPEMQQQMDEELKRHKQKQREENEKMLQEIEEEMKRNRQKQEEDEETLNRQKMQQQVEEEWKRNRQKKEDLVMMQLQMDEEWKRKIQKQKEELEKRKQLNKQLEERSRKPAMEREACKQQ